MKNMKWNVGVLLAAAIFLSFFIWLRYQPGSSKTYIRPAKPNIQAPKPVQTNSIKTVLDGAILVEFKTNSSDYLKR